MLNLGFLMKNWAFLNGVIRISCKFALSIKKRIQSMNFFRKHTHTPVTEQPQPTPMPENENNGNATALTPEGLARQWFSNHFGTPMPEEVLSLFRSIARTEAQRSKAADNLCGKQELAQLKEARRLCETKLENTEQSLERLRHQQEWFNTFVTLTHKLDVGKTVLYGLNKQYAAVTGKARELERYEAFESVQGIFQRIRVLEKEMQRDKNRQTETATLVQQLKKRTDLAEEAYKQADRKRTEAEDALVRMHETLAEGYRIKGALAILQTDLQQAESQASRLQQTLFALDKERQETANEIQRIENIDGQERQELQNLQKHHAMLEHNELIQAKLDLLFDIYQQRMQLQRNLDSNLKRQNEQNELLNRLFGQYQALESQILSLQSELQVHRQSNHGLDNYSLQERAMLLKDRRQRLQSASLLWKHISAGYEAINEKEQSIIRLKLHTEHQADTIRNLERETNLLRQQCEELKYAYTLSKSQNVIQLRSDLREGQSCSVCGATHHPFHSDTMLEQSKLISEIKTDYELTADELKKKEQWLMELKLDQAAQTSKLTEERSQLEEMKERHEENIREWEPYKALDRSFTDCSPSTNMEGRMVMLQQLIEKTGVDAEDAQKELDSFNYHQNRINQINERIAQHELDKNNLTVRLNEVNTACQVLAHNVESLQQYTTGTNRHYSQLYEELDRRIPLAGWLKEWMAGPENIKMRIQQMAERWTVLKRSTERNEATLREKKYILENIDLRIKNLRGLLENISDVRTDTLELVKDKQNTYRKLFGEKDVKDCFMELSRTLNESRQEETSQRETLKREETTFYQTEGIMCALDDDNKRLEEMLAEERSALDLWMRKYNANHPPVQLIELERVFASEEDWNSVRETVRELDRKVALAQAHVDSIRAELTAHQADGMRPNEQEEETREALMKRKLQLEHQRREIMSQIAAYDVRLASHEKAQEQTRLCTQDLQDIASQEH